ncbi:MAG: transposase [Chloroflexi bacterium]|nr:transposase [Chloroflexota bacterium]
MLVRAILIKRSLSQTELARTYPRALEPRTTDPKHVLLYRVKRLSRFLANDQVDPQAVQLALLPYVFARLGPLYRIGLCIDWTFFDAPTFRVQILKIGLAREGRVVPLLQVAYNRDRLPRGKSQNQIEEEALAAVLAALPKNCRPVILADRGFARSEVFQWLNERKLDFVIRIKKGTCITDACGTCCKLGVDLTLRRGEQLWLGRVRYALYHDHPSDIFVNFGCSWITPESGSTRKKPKDPEHPWYLATSMPSIKLAVAWYQRRFWIEEAFRDDKSRLLLDDVRVESTLRLNRLLMALTIAVCWLCLIADSKTGVLPPNWNARVVTWGKAGLVLQALAYLDTYSILPKVLEAT